MYLLDSRSSSLARHPVFLSLVGIAVGVIGGGLAIANPLYFAAAFLGVVIVVCFFNHFEYTLIFLLVLRSGLDPFSDYGITSIFGIGLNGLALVYFIALYLTKQKIYIDKVFLIFSAFTISQGLWLVLTAVGALPLDSAYLSISIREWVRIFSWLMVYLLVSQLKVRMPPERAINSLFFALAIPLIAAILQLTVPIHLLPDFLLPTAGSVFETGSRINASLGHPNTFATFLILFIGLTYWKIGQTKNPIVWPLLLGVEVFFLVSTKALVGLPMLVILMTALTLPRFNIRNFFIASFFIIILFALFFSSEFGRERLVSALATPIFNPDITVNRAVLLSWFDGNSFNWRLAQWTFLIEAWKQSPVWGYGLDLTSYIGPVRSSAHNDYVRVLVEGGIFGSLLFFAFILYQFYHLVRTYFSSEAVQQKQFCLTLSAILLAILVGMFTENIWSHTTFFFYWWTLFSISDWEWNEYPSRKLD